MQAMKKVEIIVDSVELRRVSEVLDRLGVSGCSVIRDVRGKGDRGTRGGDELTDVFRNSYILTVCSLEQVDTVVEAIRPILKKWGGVCLVSDCAWVKH